MHSLWQTQPFSFEAPPSPPHEQTRCSSRLLSRCCSSTATTPGHSPQVPVRVPSCHYRSLLPVHGQRQHFVCLALQLERQTSHTRNELVVVGCFLQWWCLRNKVTMTERMSVIWRACSPDLIHVETNCVRACRVWQERQRGDEGEDCASEHVVGGHDEGWISSVTAQSEEYVPGGGNREKSLRVRDCGYGMRSAISCHLRIAEGHPHIYTEVSSTVLTVTGIFPSPTSFAISNYHSMVTTAQHACQSTR